MKILFFLLLFYSSRNSGFINPYYLDFCALYLSPFNPASRGGALDLADTSLIFFVGNEKFYGVLRGIFFQ